MSRSYRPGYRTRPGRRTPPAARWTCSARRARACSPWPGSRPALPRPLRTGDPGMDLGLTGRRAIVTGGTKGLGKAIAAELLAEGADVVICSRNEADLGEVAAELAALGGKIVALPCDVTDPGQVESFVAAAAAALGGWTSWSTTRERPGQAGSPRCRTRTGWPTPRSNCSPRSGVPAPPCRTCGTARRRG